MDAEHFDDILFPFNGIDLYSAFTLQRPGTTPTGLNVRAYEPSTQRKRGGARPGLTKYINQQLPVGYVSGSHKIQHLNYIVDPTPDAADDGDDPPDGVDDPSTNPPGTNELDPHDHRVRIRRPRKWRKRGEGRRHNRNKSQKKKRKFEQQNAVSLYRPFGDESLPSYTSGLTFPAYVKANSLLICALERDGVIDPNDPEVTVADTLGNTYTLLAKTNNGLFNELFCYLFYCVNTKGPGACTVSFTVQPGQNTTFENNSQAILEYSGFAPSNPLDAFVTNGTPGLGVSSSFDTGSVAINLPLTPRNEMILAAFATDYTSGTPSYVPSAGYKIRSLPYTGPGFSHLSSVVVIDHIDLDTAEDPTLTPSVSQRFRAIGASFKPA